MAASANVHQIPDLSEITGQTELLGTWNLGFFSRPYKSLKGPYKGQIIKIYKKQNLETCRSFIILHQDYVSTLRSIGIKIPETNIQICSDGKSFRLVIIQEPFSESELVRGIIQNGDLEQIRISLEGILKDSILFLEHIKTKSLVNLGFHPTLRNYAIRENQFYYFDTFPPMNLPEKKLRKFILSFAPYYVPAYFYPLLIPLMHRVTGEYYDPVKMLRGPIGSTCRLRPEYTEEILEFARSYFRANLGDPEQMVQLTNELARPPRLSKIWLTLRRLLGKEGQPNVGS
jgi:hypothetical protein